MEDREMSNPCPICPRRQNMTKPNQRYPIPRQAVHTHLKLYTQEAMTKVKTPIQAWQGEEEEVPTWDLSECCQWTGIGPGCLRVAGPGQTCCRETRQKDNTAAVGMGPRSWRPGRQRSWLSEMWPLLRHSVGHAGCPCAARGRSRHRGKMGL